MWLKKMLRWFSQSKTTKLEREIAHYRHFVQQVRQQIEQNRKKLEEMRGEKTRKKREM